MTIRKIRIHILITLSIIFFCTGVFSSCKGHSPEITTSVVSGITGTSATCGGTVLDEGSGPVFERGVCWSSSPSPMITADRTVDGKGGGGFVSSLTNLMAETRYHVRAYASNDVGTTYGNEVSFTTTSIGESNGNQIIADHTVVDRFEMIPQQYIDAVKKKLVFFGGLSHASGYRLGLELLESYNQNYQVLTYTTEPPPARSNTYLRFGQPFNWGEQMYTSSSYVSSMKGHVLSQHNSGNSYDVVGLAWCYTMHWINPVGGTKDPVHGVRWAGSSEGGPEGNRRWGLNSGDQSLTGNSVSMDTYLNQIIDYNNYCNANGIPTKWIFTTGPVDDEDTAIGGTETAVQRELKHDYIRSFVALDETRILFDYADILCWNNQGIKYTLTWNDGGTLRSHAHINPDNKMDYDGSWRIIAGEGQATHVGEVGALRLAKAMWWMLARMEGWDGN